MRIADTKNNTVDIKDIKVCKKIGGTVEETELVEGIVLPDVFPAHIAGGPSEMKDCKIAIV